MRFNFSCKNLIFLLVTTLGLIPAPALAQDARGRFTLKQQVRWGQVLLVPGDYDYAVERRSTDTVLVRNARGSMSAIIMAASISTRYTANDSQLVLERQGQGEEWFVRSLALGGEDEVLYFTPPASARNGKLDAGTVASAMNSTR